MTMINIKVVSLLSDHAVMFDRAGFAVGCSVSQFIVTL